MYVCVIINFILIITSGIAACYEWDVILNKSQVVKIRAKHGIRLLILFVLASVGLYLIYDWFGLTGDNISTYITTGKVR